MLKNYVTVAFRNLWRYKGYSFLNVAGLATGMACSLLILLWVRDELSYDRFHPNAGRLYRIVCHVSDLKASLSNAPLPGAMEAEVPEVAGTARLQKASHLFTVGDRSFNEENVYYADPSLLRLFHFPLVKGDARTALAGPNGLLLTETTARKYFGNADPIGKTLMMEHKTSFTVTGVLASIPQNSHLQFDFLLPMAFLAQHNDDLKNQVWDNFNFFGYVLLKDGRDYSEADVNRIVRRMDAIYRKNEKNLKIAFGLQPVTRIHLYSNYLADVAGNGNVQYVRIFSVVAVFILLVACINFMNLATARAARRAKEIGMRKVLGAYKEQLAGQFMGESMLLSLLAMIVALVIVAALLPSFNYLAGKALSLNFGVGEGIALLLGLPLLTGLLAGSYPALYLSAFQPIASLKGAFRAARRSVLFRNSLVVIQFAVSIVLIVGTAVVYNQLQFIRNMNLGFDKENLLYVPMTGDMHKNYQALRTELENGTSFSSFSVVSDLPTDLVSGTTNVEWEGKQADEQIIFPNVAVDQTFIQTFRMQIVAGRAFSEDFKADTNNYMVNEAALKVMHLDPATAVGKPLTQWGRRGTIVGVVKDFHFQPIQKTIEPLIMRLNTHGGFVVVRTQPGGIESAIRELKGIWQRLNPAYPFRYNFLDQDLDNLYRAEGRISSLVNAFAALAVLIACLGLFGLAAFTAERRTKEIGIRKVLGASVGGIVVLLSRDFLRLVLVAMVVATPLAWYVMDHWLDNYSYHIRLGWWLFAVAGLLALLVAFLTVSFQSIKAGLADPVKSLKSE
jgi:ABC-type antimicrobial peptide transport system permease subunit